MSSPAVGDRVRLLRGHEGVPAGAEGSVIGFFARKVRTVLVRFEQGIVEVDPALLEPAREPGPPDK